MGVVKVGGINKWIDGWMKNEEKEETWSCGHAKMGDRKTKRERRKKRERRQSVDYA